jgi:Ca2+-binding RTX toxin-like protein
MIDGGAGKDILTGGDGADIFHFSHRADSTGSVGYDRITDFVDGIVRIDLRGLGYTGVVMAHAAIGELRILYSTTNDRTYVKDGGSDFLFALEGNHLEIQDSDFLF